MLAISVCKLFFAVSVCYNYIGMVILSFDPGTLNGFKRAVNRWLRPGLDFSLFTHALLQNGGEQCMCGVRTHAP